MLRWLPATLLALFVLADPAAAHQQLLRSEPAAGDSLEATPRTLRLTFNQAVEPALARLNLFGPDGEVDLGSAVVDDGAPMVVTAAVLGPVRAGEYRIEWLVTGDDGHPVRGEIIFVVREGAAGIPSEESASREDPVEAPQITTPDVPAPVDLPASTFDSASPLYAGVRWLTFGGIVVAVGAVGFGLLLIPLVLRRGIRSSAGIAAARARAAGLGLAAVAALEIALVLRLVAQTTALLAGGGDVDVTSVVSASLTRTVWGWGWMLQAIALIVLLAGLWVALRRSGGWAVAAVGALLLSITPALSGHAAATSALAVAADAAHVLAAGGWLGTLLVMLFAAAPIVAEESGPRGNTIAALLSAFSPLALGFAGLLVLTGVYAAWLHLPGPGALLSTSYGRVLLAKLVAIAVVFAAGAYNWRRARPRVEADGSLAPLRRSAAAELCMGAVVLAITAVLVATPPPREAQMLSSGASAPDLPVPAAAADTP